MPCGHLAIGVVVVVVAVGVGVAVVVVVPLKEDISQRKTQNHPHTSHINFVSPVLELFPPPRRPDFHLFTHSIWVLYTPFVYTLFDQFVYTLLDLGTLHTFCLHKFDSKRVCKQTESPLLSATLPLQKLTKLAQNGCVNKLNPPC